MALFEISCNEWGCLAVNSYDSDEAAFEAGFQSLSQFNRVFRHFVGETPSDYRDALHRRGVGVGEPMRMTFAA